MKKENIESPYFGEMSKPKSDDPTRPLGIIPTKEIKQKRMQVHAILDPIWKECGVSRKILYSHISGCIGKEFHSADIRSVEEADNILKIISKFKQDRNL